MYCEKLKSIYFEFKDLNLKELEFGLIEPLQKMDNLIILTINFRKCNLSINQLKELSLISSFSNLKYLDLRI
jgi:hypothetical protein